MHDCCRASGRSGCPAKALVPGGTWDTCDPPCPFEVPGYLGGNPGGNPEKTQGEPQGKTQGESLGKCGESWESCRLWGKKLERNLLFGGTLQDDNNVL